MPSSGWRIEEEEEERNLWGQAGVDGATAWQDRAWPQAEGMGDRRVRVSSGLPSRLSLAALKFPWSHGNSTEEPGDTARPAAPKRDDKVGER